MSCWNHTTIYRKWIIWVREVTVGQSLTQCLPEFSAGLRVAEEERRRWRCYSLLFVFSICVYLFTALTYTLRQIKPGFGGGRQNKGQPPFRRGFAERRRVVQEDQCAFSNAVELFEGFSFSILCGQVSLVSILHKFFDEVWKYFQFIFIFFLGGKRG